jgi:diaminopimelate epimerase
MASSPIALAGIPFTKMTGSGNDFVIFDGREAPADIVKQPEVIRSICNRHNGIGADGVVLLEPQGEIAAGADPGPLIRLRYFNRDGSAGELCGNATLCCTALSVRSGLAPAGRVTLATDAGLVAARLEGQDPEIDLAPVTEVHPALGDERWDGPVVDAERAGFARVGVPHVVLLLSSEAALDAVDVVSAGRPIRQHALLAPSGANVNWVAPDGRGGWAYRTYERGVEDETLACGTGAIACAILLARWSLADGPVQLRTRSGRGVTVRFRSGSSGSVGVLTSLRGEGRVVFRGTIETLAVER